MTTPHRLLLGSCPDSWGVWFADDPRQTPRNTWRHTAHIYTNWIKALYEATPYNIEDIPRTF